MNSNAPLTIAMVSTPQTWYGGEEEFYLLAKGLRERGHAVHLLVRRGGAMAERTRREGFTVMEFPGRGETPWAVWRIRRYLSRIRPDVLHYNDPHALNAAGLAAIGLGIPARIVVRHVTWPIRSPWRFRRFCDLVVCVSNDVVEVCRGAGIAADVLRVVFESTDPQKIRAGDRKRGRLAVGIADAQPMLLVVASLNEHKGHAFLLDAIPAVLRRYPNLAIVCAGEGPHRKTLEHQASQLGLGNQVRFLGYRNDVPDLFHAADLLVLPSYAGEGLPLTLVDAMLARLPFVATAVGGVSDIAGSRTSAEPVAWVVPPRNSDALAAAILDVLDHPEERAVRTERACQRAECLFTADRMVESMLAVYRAALRR